MSLLNEEMKRKKAEVRLFTEEEIYMLDNDDDEEEAYEEVDIEYKESFNEIEIDMNIIEFEIKKNPDFIVFKNIKIYLARYEKLTGIIL